MSAKCPNCELGGLKCAECKAKEMQAILQEAITAPVSVKTLAEEIKAAKKAAEEAELKLQKIQPKAKSKWGMISSGNTFSLPSQPPISGGSYARLFNQVPEYQSALSAAQSTLRGRGQAIGNFERKSFPLTLGCAYGLRVWRIDDFGRLCSLHINIAPPWRPGINTATCLSQLGVQDENGKVVPLRDTHEAPWEECACGFYGYTVIGHSELSYGSSDGYVLGLIRGTGNTLIGDYGFRTAKAEIVALGLPTTDLRKHVLANVYAGIPIMEHDKLIEYAPLTKVGPSPEDEAFWTR